MCDDPCEPCPDPCSPCCPPCDPCDNRYYCLVTQALKDVDCGRGATQVEVRAYIMSNCLAPELCEEELACEIKKALSRGIEVKVLKRTNCDGKYHIVCPPPCPPPPIEQGCPPECVAAPCRPKCYPPHLPANCCPPAKPCPCPRVPPQKCCPPKCRPKCPPRYPKC